MAACTGASDTPTSTTESAGALRVRCSVIGSELINELQLYVDGFASYSLADLPDGQVPGLADIEIRIGQSRSDAEAEGCDMAAFSTDLANSARRLQGQGPVGRPLAASLRGDPPSTDAGAVTRTVGIHDDLAGVIATAGPGSRITLEPGIYQISELLLIDRPITILGPATGETVIRSTAKDAAVMIPSAGSLVMENISIEHVGNSPASVLVAAGGDVDLGAVVLPGVLSLPHHQSRFAGGGINGHHLQIVQIVVQRLRHDVLAGPVQGVAGGDQTIKTGL